MIMLQSLKSLDLMKLNYWWKQNVQYNLNSRLSSQTIKNPL